MPPIVDEVLHSKPVLHDGYQKRRNGDEDALAESPCCAAERNLRQNMLWTQWLSLSQRRQIAFAPQNTRLWSGECLGREQMVHLAVYSSLKRTDIFANASSCQSGNFFSDRSIDTIGLALSRNLVRCENRGNLDDVDQAILVSNGVPRVFQFDKESKHGM